MIYHVVVKPNSHKNPAVIGTAEELTVHVRSKAVDGAANRELVKTLAKHFGVPKTCISIKHGSTSRHKTIKIIKNVI
jgi:uncharacterized protein (TIGR00251 family)